MDTSAHLFSQGAGDGQAQAGCVRGSSLYGVEAVEEPACTDLIQLSRVVGEKDLSSLFQLDDEISVTVFQCVGDQVSDDTGQGAPVQSTMDFCLRQMNLGGDPMLPEGSIEPGDTVLKNPIQDQRLIRRTVGYGGED